MRFILRQEGRLWWATVTTFPGAYGQGRTRAAALRNLISAVTDLIETYAALEAARQRRTTPHAARRASRRRTSVRRTAVRRTLAA